MAEEEESKPSGKQMQTHHLLFASPVSRVKTRRQELYRNSLETHTDRAIDISDSDKTQIFNEFMMKISGSLEEEAVSRCFVFRLPPEIVSEIFLAFYDPFLGRKLSAGATWGHNFPLVLTQICVGWRTVALDTPELWSFPALVLSQLPPHGIETIMHLIKHYLTYGRMGHLSIHLVLDHSFAESDTGCLGTTLEPIRSLLVTFARDWRRIVVEATYPFRQIIGSFAATLLQCPCSSLEELEYAVPGITLPTSPIQHNSSANFPRLCSFRLLSHMTRDADLIWLSSLPLHQLKTLSHMASVPSTKWLPILSGLYHSSSRLTVLEIQLVVVSVDGSYNNITLPNLSRLYLVLDTTRSSNVNIDHTFLRLLQLPLLTDLQLEGVTPSSSSIIWDLRNSTFWTRHATQLRRLTLRWCVKVVVSDNNNDNDYSTFFSRLTNLTSLAIERSNTRLTLHDIETLRNNSDLLPSLTHFTFSLALANPHMHAQPIDTMRGVISFLEERADSSGFSQSRNRNGLLLAKIFDRTRSYGPRPSGPSSSVLYSMKSEWERLHALRVGGMDVEWLPVMSEFRGDLVSLWMMRNLQEGIA